MPKIADIEGTPNRNALKFILKEPLTWGVARSYDNAEAAKDDPLASALFDIETVAAASSVLENLSPEDQLRLEKINVLLDEEVRPYLQNDGGDLHVLALEGNILRIHYQGACGTCPSSISGTLRGIENMLRTLEPDIQVIAV